MNVTSIDSIHLQVSSTGKLRLRVESFRKSSSGTQTDISAIRKKKEVMETTTTTTTNNNNNNDAKYTGQYKKHAAPHKPARKHKPKSNNNEQSNQGESRSDRSASPDNSSTSGYSSPSAGLHSKESSPCGSKIPSPPHSLEQTTNDESPDSTSNTTNNETEEDSTHNTSQEEDRHDDSGRLLDENGEEDEDYEEDLDEDHRTVLIISDQIEAEGQDKDNQKDHRHHSGSESNYSDRSSSPIQMIPPTSMANNESKLEQNSNTLPFVRPNRRELPRIVTNGTLGRPQGNANPQSYPTKSRRLPDRSHFQNSVAQDQSRYFQPQQRIYRSNLPRPAPIHHFGPAGRVPLPPVPELERSDHERESMSPTPSSAPSPRSTGAGGGSSHAYRPLPSPLTNAPMASNSSIGGGRSVQAKPRRGLLREVREQKTLSPSRIPRATSSERDFSPSSSSTSSLQPKHMEEQKGTKVVDERLRVLLSLLESGKENADHGREDTLQYLSQLESVARRLKDQLLQDHTVPNHGSTQVVDKF